LSSRPGLLPVACCFLLASALLLALTQARLGSRLFFVVAAGLCTGQLLAVIAVRRAEPPRRWLWIAVGVAVACRVPLMVGPVNYDSDMVRYVYDGRVQRFGYNPYAVVPSDPALAHTHTADTARMPSRHARTPYPPAAQLFFRLMVALRESARVMKSVLTLLDIATIFIVLQWLRVTGRSEWLFLGYAWNPLVILEVAHSGHIDGLGVFWIALCAYWIARRRTALAAVAYTLAVATKLLPLVLAPLFLGRVKLRDIAIGAGALLLLYLPFMTAGVMPIGAVPNVVEHIRFNSPIFRPLAWAVTPAGAAVFALSAGLAAAAWARWNLDINDPAAWAWPMAITLACAPVIYPWYLLFFAPFVLAVPTLPLTVWTWTVLPVYLVWEWAQFGARWRVPSWLMAVEYGTVAAAIVFLFIGRRFQVSAGLPRPAVEAQRP
jgi:alpha-1,6-mannosyltransferase